MNTHIGVPGQKIGNSFGFVCAQVIADDVDRLLLGEAGKQLFQKRYELCNGVTGSGAADNIAAGGMECSVQRQGAMTVILKTVALGSARAQGQNRIQAVQGLDSALFVDAEDCGIERRFLIKADDIKGFFFKLRVVTCHVAAQSVRLDSGSSPDSGYPAVRNSQVPSQLAAAPVRRAIWRCLPRSAQNLGFLANHSIRNNPASMPGIKAPQALSFKTLPPACDKVRATSFQKHNPLVRLSLSQPQNHPGTANITSFHPSRLGHFSKHSPFMRSQL